VLAAQQAVAVAGGNQMARMLEITTSVSGGLEVSDNSKVMSQAPPRISFTAWLMLLALMVLFGG
jgi:hypothetical protein